MKKVNRLPVSKARRPQEPVKPYPYQELEETFSPDVVEYMVNWMNSLDLPESRK
ncbi:hypothetical protein [Pontibacter anaerobius]|uniref:Uncharacterized protein n=1 Tax=Pontibacter anaerobius TaxID=2993940 RepID=A0ABT3RB18_9BACT|nr:hypothetical protein [Pontibacter anaerobius]MCX2739061.1 hypothetical protein [Pontibacter anaerobius]